MARWDRLGGLGNVEDRRGVRTAIGGGVSIIGAVIVLALGYFGINVDPAIVNQVLSDGKTSTSVSDEYAGADDYEIFAAKVLGSADDYWQDELKSQSIAYQKPRLVLFRGVTQSGCGVATAKAGPHYCPPDQTIYLDERFFDVLTNELGATGGETAQAYVIAHEVGHHIQQLNGTMNQVMNDPRYRKTGEDSLSVRLELQADCFAGLWANNLDSKGVFEAGDIDQAIDAAEKVGDDYIQTTSGGSINPETWTHGSSVERKQAFSRGLASGQYSQCSL